MSPKFYNNLLFYCSSVRDTLESAESLAKQFFNKFNNLSKWNQVNISLIIDTDGFEKAFEEIENL